MKAGMIHGGDRDSKSQCGRFESRSACHRDWRTFKEKNGEAMHSIEVGGHISTEKV